MKALERRLNNLEAQQRQEKVVNHFISVLRYPWRLNDEEREAWLMEQLRCDCRGDCAGKSVGILVPEKCSEEEWNERVSERQDDA
jgi:hypothetical protein